jgi:Porin subfamily
MEVEMKMVKSLLLGTAAGLVAVAGAQAADMPVKAKPVLYVKICSLYGDGFYYIPGTDICLKLGGYVRFQAYYDYGTNATTGPFGAPNFLDTRTGGQTDLTYRTRSLISVDTRQQTEWGTLRTYFTVGHTGDSPAAEAIYANRGFIQFAGFTLGLASSFFDFYSSPIVTYFSVPTEDTGDGGWRVAAYTANFGNGISSTLSLEEPRRRSIVNTSLGCVGPVQPPGFVCQGTGSFNANNTTVGFQFNDPFLVGAAPVNDAATIRFPDIVWNWRIDQAWGAALIGGAVHDASAGYYGSTLTGNITQGHPADKLGWVVTAGLRINGLNGSFFQTQASYTEGATMYICHSSFCGASAAKFGIGNSLGLGYVTDGVFGTGGEVELTKAWGVYAAYDHVWWAGSKWRTSIYGGWIAFDFNDNAKALISQATCGTFAVAGGTATGVVPSATSGSLTGMTNCDPNWSFAYVGSRTQYNFTPEFYMGVDFTYQKLSTAFGGLANYRAVGGTPRQTGSIAGGNPYVIEDQDIWAVTVRFHRDFKP